MKNKWTWKRRRHQLCCCCLLFPNFSSRPSRENTYIYLFFYTGTALRYSQESLPYHLPLHPLPPVVLQQKFFFLFPLESENESLMCCIHPLPPFSLSLLFTWLSSSTQTSFHIPGTTKKKRWKCFFLCVCAEYFKVEIDGKRSVGLSKLFWVFYSVFALPKKRGFWFFFSCFSEDMSRLQANSAGRGGGKVMERKIISGKYFLHAWAPKSAQFLPLPLPLCALQVSIPDQRWRPLRYLRGVAEAFRGKSVTLVSIMSDPYLSVLPYHEGGNDR